MLNLGMILVCLSRPLLSQAPLAQVPLRVFQFMGKVKRDIHVASANNLPSEQDIPPRKKAKVAAEEPGAPGRPSRVDSPWKVGAHVSSAGGVENAISNAAKIGANSFALFVKSQRKWSSPALKDANIAAFKSRMKEYGYSPKHVLPHGSYLINLGNPDDEKRQKSYECLLDDLKRCEQLGLELYNFHPGSTVGAAKPEVSISLIAKSINAAHKATKFITIVIENMAGGGGVIGSSFTEIASIIAQVDDKKRIGVCLDTCHTFAAGYDIRTKAGWDSTISKFDAEVGLQYLRGMHLNDSKTGLGSKKDRHENMGLGHLGLATFQHVLTDSRIHDIPIVLETENFEKDEVWEKEIEVLNRLSSAGRVNDDGSGAYGHGKKFLEELVGEVKKVVNSAASTSKKAAKPVKGKKKKGQSDDEE